MSVSEAKKQFKICNLTLLLNTKGWTVEEAASAIGDSTLRLYRVLDGDEKLGKTATLAAIALKSNLEPIEYNEAQT